MNMNAKAIINICKCILLQDFQSAGNSWTHDLCMADSDDDGMTNGEELGDPHCKWAAFGSAPQGSATGHPGKCEVIKGTSI